MPYVDPQDLAFARAAEAKAEMEAQQRERIAEYTGSRDVGRGLFQDSRQAWLNEQVRVDLNRQRGHVPWRTLADAQAREWERWQPVIAESPGMPLEMFKDVVAGSERPKLDDAGVAALRKTIVNDMKVPVYNPTGGEAQLDALNARLPVEKPVLNALFKSTGAGNSLRVARGLLTDARESPRQGGGSILNPVLVKRA